MRAGELAGYALLGALTAVCVAWALRQVGT